jgi:mannose-1-phosphate guanylyltransferase
MKTVILAAGFGSRLWPLSTSEKPKQFQPLFDGVSPLSYTYAVVSKAVPKEEIYVLGLEGMQELIKAAIPAIDEKRILLVPERRNTLPHTLWAVAKIAESGDEPVLFKSGDRFILNEEAFVASLQNVQAHYENDTRFTITLLCTKYQTYNSNDGYCVVDDAGRVAKFLEKPAQADLEQLAAGKTIYRSPFVFIATKNALIRELDAATEDWAPIAKEVLQGNAAASKKAFLAMPFIDISSTLFQASQTMRVMEIRYEFVDVGRFEEVYELNNKDACGNVVLGSTILEKSRGNLVINETGRPLVVIGKENTIIVQTPAGSLVSSFADAPLVGEIYKKRILKH